MTAADTPHPGRRADWLISAALFAGLALLYFATVSGITSSNDGSHYALLRTLVDNRAFALQQFDDYAEGNDIAITPDGRLFSDRPPGTALAAAPFYVLGEPLPDPLVPLPSRHDADNPRLPYVLLLPVFAGAATAVVLYWLLRYLEVGRGAALTAVLFFALGTTQWKYSTVLFSHALSGFLVVASVTLALLLADRELRGPGWHALLGFALGAAVVVEYSNALLVVVVLAFWLWRTWRAGGGRVAFRLAFIVAGGLLPAAFLAWYNTVNFGGPLTLSYAYAVNYPWAGQLATTFNFPLLPGLRALLWWGEGGGWCGGPPCLNQGLILLSPVLLLALPGLPLYLRRRQSAFALTTGLFVIYLLLFATHHTFHGFTGDGRYLTPFLGLLVPPLGFALDWLFAARRGRGAGFALGLLVAYGLFFVSLRNQALHIGTSYNYTLDLGRLTPPLALPGNWAILASAVLPNVANLPLLVVPFLVILVLAAVVGRFWPEGR